VHARPPAPEVVRHPIVESASKPGVVAESPARAPGSIDERSSRRVADLAATSGFQVRPPDQNSEPPIERVAGGASSDTLYTEVPVVGHPVGVLVVVEGRPEGQAFAVLPGVTSIGREVDNKVELTPPEISRYHAALHHEEGVFWLEVLATDNETAVNGENLDEPREIADGDLLQFARTKLRFRTIQGL
jgi:hypothetical protein